MTNIKVLSVASEIYPLVKTGGLADVIGALPAALSVEGIAVCTLVPGYPSVAAKFTAASPVDTFTNLFGSTARIIAGTAAGHDLFVLDAPHLYDRPGDPYRGPDGRDWPDNAFRFAALAQAAARIGRGLVPGFVPDIVHAHDWQAGLAPALLFYSDTRPKTVMTAHNLSFQGVFPAELLSAIGLPPHSFTFTGVEYHGSISYLKAGLQLADRLTTVSPTYSREIRTPAGGMGLDGLLRTRATVLSGFLNGIDDAVWNPADDPCLAATYTATRLKARGQNKSALQRRIGLEVKPEALLFGVVSRLSLQKGLDLLITVMPTFVELGAQFALLLGGGDQDLENAFSSAQSAHPGRISCVIGHDETLAHLIQAGVDALIIPSRFEPCGITQLCALRYGALPVVARVGGLADAIIDANQMALVARCATGIQFAPVDAEALKIALQRTAELFLDRSTWIRTQRNGMATDVSWRKPAQRYASLYRELVSECAT
jgi:starch synthase